MTIEDAHDATMKEIAADLCLLKTILTEAGREVAEACKYIVRGERNGAIGAIAGLDVKLGQAIALYGAALALHHNDRTALHQKRR